MDSNTQTSLSGKVAIVTGASSGLGAAVARLLAQRGANVLITARRKDRLQALVAEITAAGGIASHHAGDASQEETADTAVFLALERYGRVDILINNAGQGNYKQLVETTPADFDELMNANVRSGFLFTRAAAPHMIAQRSGTIIFISSVAGLAGAANESVYCATKFAQVGFAQALDAELRPHGIKVEVLCPGGIKTDFAVGRGRDAETIANSTMMDPADVAETVVFACSLPQNLRIPSMVMRHMG